MPDGTRLHTAPASFMLLGAFVLLGYGAFVFLRGLGVASAASLSAYSVLLVMLVLGVRHSVKASSNAANALGQSHRKDLDWSNIKLGSEETAVYSVGEIAPITFLAAYIAFAVHQAVAGDLAPTWFAAYAGISLWLIVLGSFVIVPRFLVWLFKGAIPSWIRLLEFPLRLALSVVGAFYAAELIADTTTRQGPAYFATGLAAIAACFGLMYGSTLAGLGAGRLTANATARFCKATRRILKLQPSAAYVVHWLETLIREQVTLQVGAAVPLSLLAYSVARIVNATVVFAVVAFLGLLPPLLSVIKLACNCDRTVYYQIPRTFFIFAAAHTAVVFTATALAYGATRGVTRGVALAEERFGVAVFPDFLFFFASTPLADLPLWAQVEGASLGALAAVVVCWVAAVVQRRDWMELSTGAVVVVGATAIPAATGLFEADAMSFLQQRLPVTPKAVISFVISAVVMAGYRLLTTRIRKEGACSQCGETDVPPFAKFCPTCGCVLDKTSNSE